MSGCLLAICGDYSWLVAELVLGTRKNLRGNAFIMRFWSKTEGGERGSRSGVEFLL